MIVGSRTLMRLSKSSRPMMSRAAYSTSASDEYHTLDDQLFHEMQNPVAFQGDKAAIFDSTEISERRFVPFEIKELTFKSAMGAAGAMTVNFMIPIPFFGGVLIPAGFTLNWAFKSMLIMTSTVRKIDLHKDGKTVTIHPRIGSAMDVKISDVQKMKHEKDLIQTFEESYLFPVQIAGKQYYLHGQG